MRNAKMGMISYSLLIFKTIMMVVVKLKVIMINRVYVYGHTLSTNQSNG